MRQEIYQWMKDLAFFHVLTTAILHILPDKRYEQYVRLFMGLLLILLICTPVFAVVGKSQGLSSACIHGHLHCNYNHMVPAII